MGESNDFSKIYLKNVFLRNVKFWPENYVH